MSLPSVRSSSTLTPIENLDHHESVSLGVTQRNNVPLSLTDPSGNPVFVHTREKSILQDSVLSQSDESIAELKTLQSHGDELDSEMPLTGDLHAQPEMTSVQKGRTILPLVLKNAWKVKNLQDVTSNKGVSGPASPPDDSILESDNAAIAGSDRDNTSEVNMGKEEATMYDNEEDGNSKNNIAFHKDNARKEAAVDADENTIKGSNNMFDEHDNTIKWSDQFIDEHENTIIRSNQLNDEYENTITRSNQLIDEHENTIKRSNQLINERENSVKVPDHIIDKHENTIRRSSQLIDGHEKTIKMPDQIIDKHENTIRRSSQLIDEHEKTIKMPDQIIDKHENTIRRSSLLIDEHEKTIKMPDHIIDKHENTTTISSHINDGSEDYNNQNESIFDTDFYDDINNNDRKEFSADDSFLGSDAVSSHSRRATLDSTKLFKTESTKSRRSSVYYEVNSASDYTFQTAPSVDETSIKVARKECLMSSQSQDSTSFPLSLEAENSGETQTHTGENKHTGFARTAVENGGKNNDKDHNQEVFFLDMLKDKNPNMLAATEATPQKPDKPGDEKLETNLNNNSDSINKITHDKSTTNTNTGSGQQLIQKHAMANIKLSDLSEEQIKATEAGGINYTEGEGSTDVQSVHSGDNVYGHRDVSIPHPETWGRVDQHESSDTFNTEPTEQKKGRTITVPADDDDKYTLTSNGDENRKRSLTDGSDVGVEGNDSDLRLDDHSKQGLLSDAAEKLKTTSEVKVENKENITEDRKVNIYSKHEKVTGKEGSKSISKSRDQSKENSKSASETLPKQPISNRQSNYKSIVEMKALDRLLTGPYSENLSKKTPSQRRGTYGNATKASTSRTHKQNRYIKLSDVDEDNQTSKPTTSETNDRVNSSRKNGANNKKTGSAKSTQSNTVSSRSIFTAPPNQARPVKAGDDLFADNKTIPDKTKKPAVSTHPRQHNQTETTIEMISSLPALQPDTEKCDLPEASANHTFEKAATIETATENELEKDAISIRDESVEALEKVTTSVPEYIPEENMSIPDQQEQTEVHDNDINLQADQGKLELDEKVNIDIELDMPREEETQINKTDKLEMGKKSAQLRDWSMTRAKIKASLPQLVRTKRAMQNTEQTNGRDQSLDVKGTFAKTVEDTKVTAGSATKKIEEPSHPKARDVKETVRSATKKTEQLSNSKLRDTKNTIVSATKKIEEPPNSKTQDTIETVGSATKRTEEPRNPKTRETKETVGSATKKTEEPPHPKTKEASGSTTKKTEQPPNPKTRDTKESVGSAAKKRDQPPNPKTQDTQETKKPLTKETEEPATPDIQDINKITEPATKTTKETLVPKTQDRKDTSEPTIANTEESAVHTDQLITPPASIAFVDETLPPQTQPNFLIDQVIMQDILYKYKTKPTADYTNSTTDVLPNGSPGSPPPEPLIGNGVNKFQDRSAAKSVSIHSLSVPGAQPNTFSGDPPLDEDTISIYSRRDSVRQSFDSGSRKSVDYRIRNTALVVLPTSDEKPKSVLTNDESFIKNAIPFLPMKLAVLCLILNIVVPGSGTALSGLAIICCGQPRVLNKDDQILITLCANCMVGLAQLCTITFLLVGWFWSVSWGIEMVILSVQHERNLKEQRTKEIQSLALNAFGSPKRPPLFGI